jgi:hypothetical protein
MSGPGSGGYDEEDFDSDGMNPAHMRIKAQKNQKSRKSKMNQNQNNSDLEGTGD